MEILSFAPMVFDCSRYLIIQKRTIEMSCSQQCVFDILNLPEVQIRHQILTYSLCQLQLEKF